ncbi:ATP/GTP-binding protein [Micromonospora sp. NPDC049836]|uniref:ATP/GTP-binding protein n=1 Tax=Micromonospora sp. NPDC049836 TaxID=3364274 RepID=UPI0037AEFBD3
MLLSFRFTNHRSFRDENQLNLTPVYGDSGEPGGGGVSAVLVAGIFGANASGKSNCLDALGFMRRMAVQSDRAVEPGLGLAREPFRLAAESLEGPSRYVVDLLIAGVRHTYGFTIDDQRVLDEWLYHYPVGRRRRVFEREGDTFTWGEESGRQPELEQISRITAPTALFLSTVARFGHGHAQPDPADPQPLHDTYRWFYRITRHLGPDAWAGAHPARLEAMRPVIVDLLRAADIGIVDMRIPPDPAGDSDLEELRATQAAGGMRGRIRAAGERALTRRARPQFAHRGTDGDVFFDFEDESTGTRQLLSLGLQATAILQSGGTMLIDEIDSSLHPILTAKLISMFRSSTANPLRSQLLFTSHDAALLGTVDAEEVLHRDEIWFTAKDDQGCSSLYPLTDFKPRKEGENRQRRYLNGNYGAVPDLSTPLFEQALAIRGRGETGRS